jgi:hypothetical protein
MKPFQVTMPAIALQHLTQATRDWLVTTQTWATTPFMSASYEEGFFIRIPACEAMADPDQVAEFCSFPEDLQHVFRALQPHAPFAWIMLDVDGDPYPGLSFYKE